MSDKTDSTAMMDLAAFEALLDAHGHDSRDWPDQLRRTAEKLLVMSPEARALLSQDVSLHEALADLPTVKASGVVKARILQAFGEAPETNLLEALWPFGPLWRPATALIAVAALGLYLGTGPISPVVPLAGAGEALGDEIIMLGQGDSDTIGPIAFADMEVSE